MSTPVQPQDIPAIVLLGAIVVGLGYKALEAIFGDNRRDE